MKLLDWIPFEKIDWQELSKNTSPGAIELLEKNFEKIDWIYLSGNPNAIHLLEKNPAKIDWYWLSQNPNAIHLLEKNPEKIVWYALSLNSNAIHLLEKNPEKIHWGWFSKNPSIFEEDYQTLSKERTEVLREELVMKTWHPKRFTSWCLDTEEIKELEVY